MINSRIKEIGEQVGLCMEPHYQGGFPNEQLLSALQFADLIVRDCLDIMENCDGDLDFAIWKMKKTFLEQSND